MSALDVADSCRLKDGRKELKVQMKLCRDDRGLMSANQSMGASKTQGSLSDRNLSGKYQKVTKFASPPKSQITCGRSYRSLRLKHAAFGRKEEKLGQFSMAAVASQTLLLLLLLFVVVRLSVNS